MLAMFTFVLIQTHWKVFFKIHLHLKALFTELKKCTELLLVVQLFSTEAIGVQIIRECMGMKGICP